MSVYGMCSVCVCVYTVYCVCMWCVCSDGWRRIGLKIELKNMLKSEKVNIY